MCRVASAGDLKVAYYSAYIWVAWGSKRGVLILVGGQLVLSCAPDLGVRGLDCTLCGSRYPSRLPPSAFATRQPIIIRCRRDPLRQRYARPSSPSTTAHLPLLATLRRVNGKWRVINPSTAGMASPRPNPHACTPHSATSSRRPSLTALLCVRSCVHAGLMSAAVSVHEWSR